MWATRWGPPRREELPRPPYRPSNGAVTYIRTHTYARTRRVQRVRCSLSFTAAVPGRARVGERARGSLARARFARNAARESPASRSRANATRNKNKSRERAGVEERRTRNGQRSRRELFPRWPTERSIFMVAASRREGRSWETLRFPAGAKSRGSVGSSTPIARTGQPSPFSSLFLPPHPVVKICPSRSHGDPRPRVAPTHLDDKLDLWHVAVTGTVLVVVVRHPDEGSRTRRRRKKALLSCGVSRRLPLRLCRSRDAGRNRGRD